MQLLAAASSGERFKTATKVYIADVKEFYLLYNALRALNLVDVHFPTPRSQQGCSPCVVAAVVVAAATCACEAREGVPGKPAQLPLKPAVSNVPAMKRWLLKRYSALAFNKCTYQPLPEMRGPPVEIHLTKNPIPQRVSTPATVSLHWQEQVKANLDKDKAMGVIERVEEPSEWCQ